MRNRNIVISAILLILIISIGLDLYYYNKVKLPTEDGPWQIAYSDFRVFWTTAKDFHFRYINDPYYGAVDSRYGPIYDEKKEFYHFRYSPFVAFAFIPLSMLPMGMGLLTWSLFLNICYVGMLAILYFVFKEDKIRSGSNGALATSALLVLSFVFYLNNIALGQSDIFVALLLAAFILCYRRARYIPAGMLFALILQFKPFFAPALIYFLLSKRWRLVLYTVISMAVFLAIPLVRPGYRIEIFSINFDWIRMISSSVSSQIENIKNRSFIYMVLKIFGMGGHAQIAYKISSFFYLILLSGLFFIRRVNRSWNPEYFGKFEISYLIMAALLASPLVWKASFIYTIIPVAFILFEPGDESHGRARSYILGGFFFLTTILGSDVGKYIPYTNLSGLQPLAFGTALLFAYIIRRAIK